MAPLVSVPKSHEAAHFNGPLPPHARLVDRVAERLRTAVLEGRLSPGASLSVPELAKQLGVSRSPVREALIHLTAAGLTEEIERRGIRVIDPDDQECGDFLELATALEAQAAVRLARHGAPESVLDTLERLCDQQQQALERDGGAEWRRLHRQFHRLLVMRCGNESIARRCIQAFDVLRVADYGTRAALGAQAAHPHGLTGRDAPVRATLRNRELVSALRAGDGRKARQLVEAQLHP